MKCLKEIYKHLKFFIIQKQSKYKKRILKEDFASKTNYRCRVNSGLVHQRDMLRKFIRTVTTQLSMYIDKYPLIDQSYLLEFISILVKCEAEADLGRVALSKFLDDYCHNLFKREEYFRIPFLWFTHRFFTNANLILSTIETYYADLFYEYICKQLRGTPKVLGAFKLINNCTPLMSLDWEELQEYSHKIVPLKEEELTFLKLCYSVIPKIGIQALNMKYLKKEIKKQRFSVKPLFNLTRFFTLLDSRWQLLFHFPFFDLEKLIFHFQLSESTTLNEIIDFKDQKNTIVCSSDVYRILNTEKSFIGVMNIPTLYLDRLQSYFVKCQHKGKLNYQYLGKVNETKTSSSLHLYKANKGWLSLNKTQWNQLIKSLKTKKLHEKTGRSLDFYETVPYNKNWSYKEKIDPLLFMKMFCNVAASYSVEDLKFSRTETGINTILTRDDIGLLKLLHYQRILHVNHFSFQLLTEFSLGSYMVEIPIMPLEQLSRLQECLPYTQIFLTNEKIYLWAYLSSEFVKNIVKELKWRIFPIALNHSPSQFNWNWFDPDNLEWKCPVLLNQINA